MQYQGTEYTMSEFSTYQTETGKDAHSKTQNPLLSDVNNANFHLTINSPAIDAGVSVGITHDFDLNSIPLGDAPDIGAFEYNSCLAPFPAGQLRREFKVSGTFYDDIGGHHRTYLFAAIMPARDYC